MSGRKDDWEGICTGPDTLTKGRRAFRSVIARYPLLAGALPGGRVGWIIRLPRLNHCQLGGLRRAWRFHGFVQGQDNGYREDMMKERPRSE